MKPLSIIGGGIAGLATAWAAQKAARPYRLFEASDRLGGKIRSIRREGFLLEAGPDSFLVEKPEGLSLCHELGLENKFVACGTSPKVRILHQGALVPLPPGCRLFIPTDPDRFRTNTLLSTEGTERALAEAEIPPRQESVDESVGAFISRRFGPEMLERVAGPILAGIYGANPFELSLQATFAKFARLEQEHGSLIRALATKPTPSPAPTSTPKFSPPAPKPSAPFVSLATGMQAMVDALVPRLNGEIHLRTAISELPDGPVVLAIPAFAAADLFQFHDPILSAQLRGIRTVSTATINLAYDRDGIDPPEGFGFMSTLDDLSPLVGCTWVSNKFPGRSPANGFLARAFVGGQKDQGLLECPEDELVSIVHNELARLHPGLRIEPRFSLVSRWHQGNPQYEVGHLERLAAIEARLPPSIQLVGSSYRGVGLSDIIRSANALFEPA